MARVGASKLPKKIPIIIRYLVIFIAGLAIGWLAFSQISSNKKSVSQLSTTGEDVAAPSSQPTSAHQSPGCKYPPRKYFSFPVLMYHHIRELIPNNQPYDSLSVSAASFEKQLNDIQALGLQTTTFADVVANCIPPKPIILSFDDGYLDAFTQVLPVLKAHDMVGVFYIPTGFIGSNDYMHWDQVSSLAKDGMEIGGHTIHHLNLLSIPPAQAQTEIQGGIDELKKQTSQTIVSFAYPYGTSNPSLYGFLKQAGIRYAMSITRSLARSDFNAYEVPRYPMYDSTQVNGMFDPAKVTAY